MFRSTAKLAIYFQSAKEKGKKRAANAKDSHSYSFYPAKGTPLAKADSLVRAYVRASATLGASVRIDRIDVTSGDCL